MDKLNERVLEYNSPLTSQVANVVLGAPDFTTAGCVAVDATDIGYPEEPAWEAGPSVQARVDMAARSESR